MTLLKNQILGTAAMKKTMGKGRTHMTEVKYTNHGADAASGFIYQTFYAIIVSLKDDNWDSLKIEPLTSKGKTDIAFYEKEENKDEFYENGANIRLLSNNAAHCYKKIQVKKRTDAVSEKSLRDWCNDLVADDKAEFYELCLFGSASKKIPLEHCNNVTILNNDYDVVIETIKNGIAEYFGKKDVADYSEEDLKAVFNDLFTKMHLNSIEQNRIKREEFNDVFKEVLKRSPFYKAANLKLKSKYLFESNKMHSRDLSTSRLDKNCTGIIEKKLSYNEFPILEEDSFEKTRCNLFSYVAEHVNDIDSRRNIYIYGGSGSGKSTYLYGIWKEYLEKENYIPIYVPLYAVNDSIKKYIKGNYLSKTLIKNFKWLKGEELEKTPYQIIILLDGYNELADNSDKLNSKLKKEINEFLGVQRFTVILTSRESRMSFDRGITTFKILDLNEKQIREFLGGNIELSETWYNGLLNNPFMLEICVKAFGDTKDGIKNVEKASTEMILQEYINKQVGRKKEDKKHENITQISATYKLYMEVLLALAAMILDKKEEKEEIPSDPKKYCWEDFEAAVNTAYEQFSVCKKSINRCIGNSNGYNKYLNKIKKQKDDNNLAYTLLNTGIALELFNSASQRGSDVIWDHEIYRDYFVARGYALYSSTHKNAVRIVNNLTRQVNYRYPEPKFKDTLVSKTIREYHVRKAQMFIDMVDARLTDHWEFNTDNLKKLKKTAIYRRLVRDVALIYEDMQDTNMMRASDIGLKYYTGDRSIYDYLAKYDDNYSDPERRYADAAYSITSLAYNYTHERLRIKGKEEEYKKKSIEDLEKADKALKTAGSLYNELSEKMKENETVSSDILKYYGNCAAYSIALSKVTDDKDQKEQLLKTAQELHRNNLKTRLELKSIIEKNGESTNAIRNEIASSYNGIATCYYHMGQYQDAIQYQKMVVDVRPENNITGRCTGYRNIVGCYAKYKDYSSQEADDAVKHILITLECVVDNKIYNGFGKLKKDISIIRSKLTDEQTTANKEQLKRIDSILESISK